MSPKHEIVESKDGVQLIRLAPEDGSGFGPSWRVSRGNIEQDFDGETDARLLYAEWAAGNIP